MFGIGHIAQRFESQQVVRREPESRADTLDIYGSCNKHNRVWETRMVNGHIEKTLAMENGRDYGGAAIKIHMLFKYSVVRLRMI